MTCEHVREQLLTEATSAWGPLETHLDRCPDCRALAGRIREEEAALADRIETFVAREAPALPAVEPVRRHGWLYVGLIALAAAAVLALSLSPRAPVGPVAAEDPIFVHASPPPELVAAEDATQRFFDALAVPVGVEAGAPRAEQDEALRQALSLRAAAMVEAEAALQAAAASDDPLARAIALHDLGDVHLAMGDALEHFLHPSYLTPEQSEVYQGALDDKAGVQRAKAAEVWRAGVEDALSAGLIEEANALQTRVDELALAAPPPVDEDDLEDLRADLTAQKDELQTALASCEGRLDPGSVAEVQAVIDQADAALARADVDRSFLLDVGQFLTAYVEGVAMACGGAE